METFSELLALCAGNTSVTGEFPAQKPVTRSFDVFFDQRLNKWLNKHLSDLRRHCAHYDVTLMTFAGRHTRSHDMFAFAYVRVMGQIHIFSYILYVNENSNMVSKIVARQDMT